MLAKLVLNLSILLRILYVPLKLKWPRVQSRLQFENSEMWHIEFMKRKVDFGGSILKWSFAETVVESPSTSVDGLIKKQDEDQLCNPLPVYTALLSAAVEHLNTTDCSRYETRSIVSVSPDQVCVKSESSTVTHTHFHLQWQWHINWILVLELPFHKKHLISTSTMLMECPVQRSTPLVGSLHINTYLIRILIHKCLTNIVVVVPMTQLCVTMVKIKVQVVFWFSIWSGSWQNHGCVGRFQE